MLGADGAATMCSNCGTGSTTKWRVSRRTGLVNCAECRAYYTAHGTPRPVSPRAALGTLAKQKATTSTDTSHEGAAAAAAAAGGASASAAAQVAGAVEIGRLAGFLAVGEVHTVAAAPVEQLKDSIREVRALSSSTLQSHAPDPQSRDMAAPGGHT